MSQSMTGGDFNPIEQAEFDRLKALVLAKIPEAEQSISYGMPTLKFKNKLIFHVGAFSDHMSLFPGPDAIEAVADKLKDFTTAKGTIQFKVESPLPDTLVNAIIDYRLKDIASS